MIKDARFYFASLGVDVGRCVSALLKDDLGRYQDHLAEAHRTLEYLRGTVRTSAYEEGKLMLLGMKLAREDNKLSEFNDQLNELIAEYSPLV